MISEDTKKLVESSFPSDFDFEANKIVEVPAAKRSLQTYFVTSYEKDLEWLNFELFIIYYIISYELNYQWIAICHLLTNPLLFENVSKRYLWFLKYLQSVYTSI